MAHLLSLHWAGLIFLGLAALCAPSWALWMAPAGPRLVLSLPATETPSPAPPDLTVLPATPTITPQCGGPPVMYLLMVGKDTQSADYTDGFADVIRIARIDFRTPSMLLLAIPRDTEVRIVGLETLGIMEDRLRSAYALGYAHNIPGGGISLLAQTLVSNFGVRIDHYAVANFDVFAQGIDTIGGVEVDVIEGATGFRPGLQQMDGQQALNYARLRQAAEDPSDLARIDRQSQVLRAIQAKLLSPAVLPKLPLLVDSLRDSVLTDLSPSQITSLLCIGRLIGSERFENLTIPTAFFTRQLDANGHELFNPDYPAIREFIGQFNQDNLPPQPAPLQ